MKILTSSITKLIIGAAVFSIAFFGFAQASLAYNSLTFSTASVSLSTGQSTTVTVYGGSYGYNPYYISQNSNSNVATASASGSQVNIYAVNSGTTSITVCDNSVYNCGTIYVTVSGGNNGYGNGSITFSPSNPSMYVGQSTSVYVSSNNSYNYGSYYISQNTNSSVVSASMSGSTINLYALTNGSSSITVCQNSYSSCGTLYVTVNGGSGYGSGNITFSPSNPTLSVGQSTIVTAYSNNGYNYGSFYISQKTNSSIVSASVSGSTISLYGLAYGSSTLTVCQSSYSSCGTLYVNVTGGNGYGNGTVTFSTTNPAMYIGQSLTVQLYSNNSYSGSYYVYQNGNNSIVTASTSGSTLNLYALNSGSSSIMVCQNNANTCGTIMVSVTGNNNGGYGNGSITFSPSNPTLSVGQSMTVTAYSNNGYNYGSYYVSQNTNSSVVSASISSSLISLYALTNGSSTITVCQNSYSSCGTLYVTVSGGNNGYGYGNGSITFSPSNPTLTVGQSLSVTAYSNNSYNYGSYYISQNTNNAVVSASISGSTINLYGVSYGTSTITVCQNSYSACGSLYVNITGGVNYNNGNGSQVLGASIYSNGALVQDGSTIYIIYRNTKTGFANFYSFQGFGFKLGNVIISNTSSLTTSGYILSNPNRSHPWGTWIKYGITVYFVDSTGLIPIADYQTFLNNGGQDKLVVPATAYDLQLPIQSVMVFSDSRLH